MFRVSMTVNGTAFVLAVCACNSSTGASPNKDASATEGGASEPVGCAAGVEAGGGDHPVINPADFTTKIDNPYYPLVPGTKFHSLGTHHNTHHIPAKSDTPKINGVHPGVLPHPL